MLHSSALLLLIVIFSRYVLQTETLCAVVLVIAHALINLLSIKL